MYLVKLVKSSVNSVALKALRAMSNPSHISMDHLEDHLEQDPRQDQQQGQEILLCSSGTSTSTHLSV